MALFKISRGLKEKLPTTKTSGHCWYTIDDSMFYIDYEDENGEVQRKALNAQDAQTLTGASLSTILNSSDIEIPTSKTVLDALSTKVSFAGVQTLTDEQKAQARENIGAAAQVVVLPDNIIRPWEYGSGLYMFKNETTYNYTRIYKMDGVGDKAVEKSFLTLVSQKNILMHIDNIEIGTTSVWHCAIFTNVIGTRCFDLQYASDTLTWSVFDYATLPNPRTLQAPEGKVVQATADFKYKLVDHVSSVNGLTGDVVLDIPEAQIQADWEQNDETAIDYIKNRTHWVEKTSEIKTLEFPNGADSSVGATKTDLDFANAIFNNQESLHFIKDGTEIPYLETEVFDDHIQLRFYKNDQYHSCYVYLGDDGLPNGSICVSDSGSQNWSNITLQLDVTEEIVHQIDLKYLPNEATTQADWEQSDDTVVDYIKNRTHYDDTIYAPKTKDDVREILKAAGVDTSGFSVKLIDGITFRVVADGAIYDNVPVYVGCYYAGGYTWGIGDVYVGKDTKKWKSTDYGFCYGGYGLVTNPENFPNGIQSFEVYTVERELKQLDPKFIKDMYYTSEPTITEIVPETIVEFDLENGDDFIEEAIDVELVEGATYIVTWNGTKYECVCYNYDDSLVIGNNECWDGSDGNGEPFLVSNYDGITVINVYESGTYTISISTMQQHIHYVPTKYIKDMYYDNGVTVTELVPETTVEGFEVMEDPIYSTINAINMTPVIGATYVVNWDGVEYTTKCNIDGDLVYIGNKNYLYMMPGGDVPFAIIFVGDIFLVTESDATSHTISITEIVHDLKQIDTKYLPIMEEVFKTVFEKENLSGGAYEYPECKMLVGQHRITIDNNTDTSEIVEFVIDPVDEDFSFANGETYGIEFWDGGCYFEFFDGEAHSVKIESYKNVVKEEYLPDSAIISQSDWNQNDPDGNGYIKNRPFYSEDEVTNLPIIDDGYNLNLEFAWDKDSPYTLRIDEIEYSFDGMKEGNYHSASGQNVWYLGSEVLVSGNNFAVSNWTYPFSIYSIPSRISEGRMQVLFEDGTADHTVEIIESGKIHKINPKYLPDSLSLKTVPIYLPAQAKWNSITYGDGKFVAVANSSDKIITYSEDGITWKKATLPVNATNWKSITYGNGKFVAVSYNSSEIVYSEDGITWMATTLSKKQWTSITYGNGKFVAVASSSPVAAYSEDGILWQETYIPSDEWKRVTYGNGKFIAFRSNASSTVNSTFAYSEDGINWTEEELPIRKPIYDSIYANNKFVAVGNNCIIYSEDGITWTEVTLSKSVQWEDIAYGNGKFVIFSSVTASTEFAYSEDGINWTEAELPMSGKWRAVTYGNDKFVVISYNSDVMMHSKDGIVWENGYQVIAQNNEDVTNEVKNIILKNSSGSSMVIVTLTETTDSDGNSVIMSSHSPAEILEYSQNGSAVVCRWDNPDNVENYNLIFCEQNFAVFSMSESSYTKSFYINSDKTVEIQEDDLVTGLMLEEAGIKPVLNVEVDFSTMTASHNSEEIISALDNGMLIGDIRVEGSVCKFSTIDGSTAIFITENVNIENGTNIKSILTIDSDKKVAINMMNILSAETIESNFVMTPSTASIGQLPVVKAVDEDGKPTEWEAVDPATIFEEFGFDVDENGTLVGGAVGGGSGVDVTAEVGQTIVVEEVDANGKPTKWKAADYQERTHWSSEKVMIPEHTFTAGFQGSNITIHGEEGKLLGLTLGKTYVVTFDGVEYTCVAESAIVSLDGVDMYNAISIGNLGMFGYEDNGRPFVFGDVIDHPEPGWACVPYEYGSHTLSIISVDEVIQKIPAKYIPTLEETRLNETVIYKGTPVYVEDVGMVFFAPAPALGRTYKITYNGTEYACVCKDSLFTMGESGGYVLGNVEALTGTGDTGEPFVLIYIREEMTWNMVMFDGATSVNISLVEVGKPPISAEYVENSPYYIELTGDGSTDAPYEFNRTYGDVMRAFGFGRELRLKHNTSSEGLVFYNLTQVITDNQSHSMFFFTSPRIINAGARYFAVTTNDGSALVISND